MKSSSSQIEFEVPRPTLKSHIHDKYTSLVVPNFGICVFLLSQFVGSVMALSTKLLEQDTDFPEPLSPFETMFVRMALTCTVTVVFTAYNNPEEFPFGPREVRWYLMGRAVSGSLGLYTLFWSLKYISMSSSTMIGFLNPAFTLIAACFVLGERYTVFEGIGGIFAVIGVTLVVQPAFLFPNSVHEIDDSGAESSDPYMRSLGLLAAVIGCVCNAFGATMLRLIGTRCSAAFSVQMMSATGLMVSAIGLVCSPNDRFQKLTTPKQWYLFCQLGVSGFITQYLWTLAFSREKAGRLALLMYFGMIYSIMWDYVIWHHSPTLLTWVGFLVIVLSTACIVYLKPEETEDFEIPEDSDEEGGKIGIAMREFVIQDEENQISGS